VAETKRRAILAIIICTFFMAVGTTLFKYAADTTPTSFTGIITHLPFYYAIIIYGIGAILLIWGLKHGELSTLYPIIGLNFVWVAISAAYFIGEHMNNWKIAGTASICIGIACMGLHSRRQVK